MVPCQMLRKGELEGDASPASNQIVSRRAFTPGEQSDVFSGGLPAGKTRHNHGKR